MTLPLDHMHTIRTSPAWSADMVMQRLVEAFVIEKRMPGERRYVAASVWPATPIHEFTDVLHWTDARERVWESWEKAKGAYPFEVSKMEEAFDWLRWPPLGDRRCLEAWAAASAKGLKVRRMIKGRWSRTSFYRQRDRAAQHIADRLNREGVQVR